LGSALCPVAQLGGKALGLSPSKISLIYLDISIKPLWVILNK